MMERKRTEHSEAVKRKRETKYMQTKFLIRVKDKDIYRKRKKKPKTCGWNIRDINLCRPLQAQVDKVEHSSFLLVILDIFFPVIIYIIAPVTQNDVIHTFLCLYFCLLIF